MATGDWAGALWLQQHSVSHFFLDILELGNYLDQVGRRDQPTRTLRRTEVTKCQREAPLQFGILEKVGTFSQLPRGVWNSKT